jgi:hypothetical protein
VGEEGAESMTDQTGGGRERGCRNVIGQAWGEAGPERGNGLGLAMQLNDSRSPGRISQLSSFSIVRHLLWPCMTIFGSHFQTFQVSEPKQSYK